MWSVRLRNEYLILISVEFKQAHVASGSRVGQHGSRQSGTMTLVCRLVM